MTNTKSNDDLIKNIERLLREHIAGIRASAQQAVERAFAPTPTPPVDGRTRRVKRTMGKKRASADIAALGERFYKAVCAKPGETMTVLRADVGASARELHRSVTLLRRAGQVRAVGNRHLTRYFPMASAAPR